MTELPKTALACVRCDEPLLNFEPDGNHPLGGLEFTTPGHYGSAQFDPMDGSRLVVNICDGCIVALAHLGQVGRVSSVSERKFRRWNPEESS